jgi:tetratricopeptide (TPR) repeat protein
MADEAEDPGSRGGGAVDPMALSLALSAAAHDDRVAAKAEAFLDKQTALADLQIDTLRKQDEFETSHLRWRRFNDQMKGALQIMVVALGALIVVAIAAAMWNASQADGIVVEAFSVPPALAADGIGGDTAATDMTDKIAAIRDAATGNSFARSKDVHNESGEDIKVEIPETGVSLAQAWRYLKDWLGQERPLRGNIRRLTDGRIALTVALADEPAATFTGPLSDLDKLEQQAAEHVFADVDPSNYVLYLDAIGRSDEAYAAIAHYAQTETDTTLRAGFTSLWAALTRGEVGDVPLSLSRARLSLALDPKMVVADSEVLRDAQLLGYDELSLHEAEKLMTVRPQDLPAVFQGRGYTALKSLAQLELKRAGGDFLGAQKEACFYCSFSDSLLQQAEYAARDHDLALSRTEMANAITAGSATPATLHRARAFELAAIGNWAAAASEAQADADALVAAKDRPPRYQALKILTSAVPLRAEALARNGNPTAAEAAIAATPRDCYACVRTRGIVAYLHKDWSAAAGWFDAAVKLAPSLPFAYAEWGAMLVAKGDLDGAIAKFTTANRKGPHFADPLEMWGEALMLKNRSDLALAKFAEANRYAPNWGRLHLKWGEALFYTGRKSEAAARYRIASTLTLSAAEKAELERRQQAAP